MKTNTRDNVAKFFYDCAKLTFAVLVIGVIARKPFVQIEAMWGGAYTMGLFIAGIIIDQLKTKEAK